MLTKRWYVAKLTTSADISDDHQLELAIGYDSARGIERCHTHRSKWSTRDDEAYGAWFIVLKGLGVKTRLVGPSIRWNTTTCIVQEMGLIFPNGHHWKSPTSLS